MTEPEQHRINAADGTAIAWYDYGGNGPNLVLGHATGFCGRIWEPLLPYLLPRARCLTYDLRGHGASGRPGQGLAGFAWERYADDLSRILDAAEVRAPHVIGHSCGGATALLAEAAQPGTFSKMFLYEPVVFPHEAPTGADPERELAVRTRRRRRTFSSPQEALEKFSSRGPFTGLTAEALQAYVDYGFTKALDGSIELACHPDDEADVYVMASAHDGFSRLSQVQCPVTVARGAQSESFSADDMKAVADRLPGGRYLEYAGMGHFGPLEQPELIAAEALSALNL